MFHRSERLLLRPGWLEDAGELTVRIADEAIVRNLARVPWPYRREDAESWLSRPANPRLPSFLVTLPGAGGSPIIGSCGLHEEEHGLEIGYWIARDWWGRGFATEAARAVLSIASSLGHRRVHSCHAVDNPASGRVLRKAGFVPTGRVRTIHSLGRGADLSAIEFVTELDGCVGGDDPAMMPRAA
ncbi:GNAT family N-acetyltransferase [Altererythrobacter fulvus]|uniref:GNAT family N-acetyltransferase n=1 Tax=Caenibius fulvus TaxID=2126012 RepID=UPI0030186539